MKSQSPLRLVDTRTLDRGQWLEVRKGGIGSSDAAAAVGLSPYKSQLELWLEKTGRADTLTEHQGMDDPRFWGTLLEPYVAVAYQQKTDRKVRKVNAVLQHPTLPFMLANIDREVIGCPDVQILECKTAGEFGSRLWKDGVPEYVQLQVQHQLAVTGKAAADVAVTVSKLKRDVISIRELLAIGQDMGARVLARTFVEDVEIAMALALSPETCEAFRATSDTNEFWNKHIGYGRVYDKIREYLLACGVEDRRVEQLVDRHRDAKKMFSETTHGGRNSALMSAFPPSLSDRGQIHFLSLGAVTYATAELALFIAQETHAFAGSVVKGTLQPSPLHLFESFDVTGRHMNAVAAAYVLQELLVRYEDDLERRAESF